MITSGVLILSSNESSKDLKVELRLLFGERDEELDLVMTLTAEDDCQALLAIPPPWEDVVFGQAVFGTALRTPFHNSSF